RAAHDRAVEIIRNNMAKLNQIAQYLIERETITGEEFMDILNEPVALPEAEEEPTIVYTDEE
ncbi:MAG: hypothetical protein IKC02_04630, partial [Oscillospiraceae bacterium]|nr:hypothetical protein [Oscillospiraceae bacterium]